MVAGGGSSGLNAVAKASAKAGIAAPDGTLATLSDSDTSTTPWWKTAAMIALWYASNTTVLVLNKLLLSYHGFKFPVTLTMIHMACCTVLSYLLIVGLQVVPMQALASREHTKKVASLAAVFTLSVMAGNISLRYIPVSFSQAIGATTPAFTAGLAFLMAGTVEKRQTYYALIPVILGIVVATGFEPSFNGLGLAFALTATVGRGSKSVLQSILLSTPSMKLSSQCLLLYMAPMALGFMLPVALVMEGKALMEYDGLTFPMLMLLFVNGCAAYLVNLSNFLVTRYTSPLTLGVLGNAKGAFAVCVSVLVFHNRVTAVGMLGYAITLAGCALYSEMKRRDKAEVADVLPTTAVGGGEEEAKRLLAAAAGRS